MSSKWSLRDHTPRILVGELENVYITAPGAHWWSGYSDGDTNIVIKPDDNYQELLINRFGNPNKDTGKIEGEINLPEDRRDQYTNWVHSMIHTTVTAIGVFVEDDEHDHKTELHPMDLIVGQVTYSLISDWIIRLARDRRLQIGGDLLAYRFAVASDDRAGIWWFEEGPPLSDVTRLVEALLEFPHRPGDRWTPVVDWSIFFQTSTDVQVRSLGGPHTQLSIRATCQAHNHGGPGVALGEVVAFWMDPLAPQFALSQAAITFGLVPLNKQSSVTVFIRNVGQVPFVLSVAAAPAGSPFTWQTHNNATIGPGATLDIRVSFDPRAPGLAAGQLEVQTSAEGSPRSIALSGIGKPF
jgi:hypothetical protein